MNEAQARDIVAVRSDNRCEIAVPLVCQGRRDSVHHRLKRGRGHEWAPSNLLAACGDGTRGCHGYVEANPTWAQSEGLWLMTGSGEPSEVAVHMRWHHQKSWWFLDDLGMLKWGGEVFEDFKLDPAFAQMQYKTKPPR